MPLTNPSPSQCHHSLMVSTVNILYSYNPKCLLSSLFHFFLGLLLFPESIHIGAKELSKLKLKFHSICCRHLKQITLPFIFNYFSWHSLSLSFFIMRWVGRKVNQKKISIWTVSHIIKHSMEKITCSDIYYLVPHKLKYCSSLFSEMGSFWRVLRVYILLGKVSAWWGLFYILREWFDNHCKIRTKVHKYRPSTLNQHIYYNLTKAQP